MRRLDRSLLHGVAWNGALKLIAQAVSWVSTLIVARELTANDYGVYGLGVLLLGLIQMLTEFGLGLAVVARRDLTDHDIAGLNTISFGLGIVGALLMVVLAPLAGLFFQRPQLNAVVVALSSSLILGSLRTVPWALMQRDLRFKRLAIYDAGRSVLLAGMSVVFALLGLGYWTLVIAAIVSAALSTAVTFWLHPVPFVRPDFVRLRGALTFSTDVVLNRLAWFGYLNADFAVASRMLGATAAGYYGLAWTLAHLVVEKVAQLVLQVTPGVLARVQDNSAQLRRYCSLITGAMALILWPATIGLALVARDFVPVVLGDRWQPIVFPLTLLSAYSSVWVLLGLVGQVLLVVGEEKFARRNNMQQFVAMSIAFVIAARWGVNGIAMAWLLVHPYFAAVRVVRLMRRIEQPMIEWITQSLMPAIIGCVIMAVIFLIVRVTMLEDLPPVWRLAAETLCGVLTYAGVQGFFFRERVQSTLRALRDLRDRPSSSATPATPATLAV